MRNQNVSSCMRKLKSLILHEKTGNSYLAWELKRPPKIPKDPQRLPKTSREALEMSSKLCLTNRSRSCNGLPLCFIKKGDKNQLRFIRTCEHNIIWYFYLYLEPSSNACIKQTAKYSTWFLSVDCTSHMIDLASKVLHEAQHAWEKNNYDTNFAYILEETYNRRISKTVSRILLTIWIIKAADFN